MIVIGSDHGGFELKEALKERLKEVGYEVKDCGTFSKEPCDYPDFAKSVATSVRKKESQRGILICRRIKIGCFFIISNKKHRRRQQ